MAIAEMQKLKEKYPQYKDIPDERLLQHVVKRYPVYAPIAEREFGAIKERKETLLERHKRGRRIIGERAKKFGEFMGERIEPQIEGQFEAGYKPQRWEYWVKNAATAAVLTHMGIEAGKIILSAPQTQLALSRLASKPELQKIPKDKMFSAMQKITSGVGKLTAEESAIWGRVEKSMERLAGAYKVGGIKTATPRFGFGWLAKALKMTATKPFTLPRARIPKEVGKPIEPERMPKTEIGKALRTQFLAKEKVPLHPAAEGRAALAKIKAMVEPPIKDVKALKAVRTQEIAKLKKTKFPIKATFMDEEVKVMGAADDFEPYKTAAKGRRDVTQLMVQRPDGTKSIMMASHLKVKGKPLITPTPKAILKKLPTFKDMITKKPPVISKVEVTKPPKKVSDYVNMYLQKQGVPSVSDVKDMSLEQLRSEKKRLMKLSFMPLRDVGATWLAKAMGGDIDKAGQVDLGISKTLNNITNYIEARIEKPKPPAEIKVKFKPGTHSVEYQTPAGARSTLMSADELEIIKTQLAAGQVPKDFSGIPIVRILDTFGVKGEAGFASVEALGEFEDLMTNITGKGEEVSSKFKSFAKKIGTPFFIGQKYPAFKPVYSAVQNGIDYKHELFYGGQAIIQLKKLAKLPVESQEKVVNIIKLGNSVAVRRWYNKGELKVKFGFNDAEIDAYERVRRLYKYSTNMEIKTRKMFMEYDKMTPDKQRIADEALALAVNKLGGYVSQTRAGGNWAVFAPPSEGESIASFFNLYKNKSDAVNAAKLIPNSKVYLRDEAVKRGIYRHLTLADLENLVEASDVDVRSSDIEALRNELRKRTFSAHWIKRKDVPGYDWTWENVLESSVDYLEGAANKLSKITGRQGAEAAFRENVEGMSPELRAYARDFIDLAHDTGQIGWKWIARMAYTWRLAFDMSFLSQNLTQPIPTTLPLLGKYFPKAQPEKVLTDSYKQAQRYFFHLWKGESHGLSSELLGYLNKLHRQGVLGDQMTRFQLAVRGLTKAEWEKWVGSFGRASEFVNRTTTAIAAYRAGTETQGLKGREALVEFGKNFVGQTQFFYGKHNLPQLVSGAGGWRPLAKTMYIFMHYGTSFLQRLNASMPWRGAPARESVRGLGYLLSLAGVKGLPFAALLMLGYRMLKGRTAESDARDMMDKANVPKKVQRMILGGAPSLMGIDSSMLLGVGDIVREDLFRDPTAILGATSSFFKQGKRAVQRAKDGDVKGALAEASPDVIRNMYKAARQAREGIRNIKNVLIATPSKLDNVLKSMGFTTITESEAYAAKRAKTTIRARGATVSSDWHRRYAWAVYKKDGLKMQRLRQERIEHNREASREDKIVFSRQSIRSWMQKFKGRDVSVPRKLRKKYKRIEELYERE